jgi:Dolichyl-phosphate-mannose-protein mannosyltransferase
LKTSPASVIALLLLAFMALLAGGAARRESVTFDEVAHTAAGVSYLQKLDMRMNEEHPPLAKLLAAMPLVLRGAHADYTHLSWTFSNTIFHQYLAEWVFGHWFLMRWNDPYSTLLWARVPMLLLTLLLGFVLYSYGTRLGNAWGGLLCLSAFVTMPAFLAFGPLVLTDVAITLFWVLTVWLLPNMWLSPRRGTVIKFALVLAGALLSKFSSGLLFFVFPAFALSLRLKPLPEQPIDKIELRHWRRRHGAISPKERCGPHCSSTSCISSFPGTSQPIHFKSSRTFLRRRFCADCSCRHGSIYADSLDSRSAPEAGPPTSSAIITRTESGFISPFFSF